MIGILFNGNAHFLKAGDRGTTVCPIQKAGQFGRAIGNGAEHDTAVGYGFITGNVDLTFDMICFFDFHFLTSDSLGFVNRVMLAENKFCCIHGSLIV